MTSLPPPEQEVVCGVRAPLPPRLPDRRGGGGEATRQKQRGCWELTIPPEGRARGRGHSTASDINVKEDGATVTLT